MTNLDLFCKISFKITACLGLMLCITAVTGLLHATHSVDFNVKCLILGVILTLNPLETIYTITDRYL